MSNREITDSIIAKVREYDRIVISRHIRPDGDAVGSTMGLCRLLRRAFPEKDIRLINEDYSDYVAFLGNEDEPVTPDFYTSSLMIVLDTATADRISNKNYSLCPFLIKIDHHVDDKPYGNISWVEDKRSSTCEMIASLIDVYSDLFFPDGQTAACVFTGMVTDSGRFRFSSTSGETLRLAGMLLDLGIDTETLYARLYLDDYSYLKYKSHMLQCMKITKHGVAYLYVSQESQRRFGLTPEQASNSVSFLESIAGSIIWLAFIENEDGTIRVRLRSRFVTVNGIARHYGGGGHECAAGATVHDRREMTALIREADREIKKYKESHENWL